MRTPKSAQNSHGSARALCLPRIRLTWTARNWLPFGHGERTTSGRQGWNGLLGRQHEGTVDGSCAGISCITRQLFRKITKFPGTFWVKPSPPALSAQGQGPACSALQAHWRIHALYSDLLPSWSQLLPPRVMLTTAVSRLLEASLVNSLLSRQHVLAVPRVPSPAEPPPRCPCQPQRRAVTRSAAASSKPEGWD